MKVAIFGKRHHINQIDFINKLLNLLKEKGVEIHLFEEFYTSIKKQVNINSKDFKVFKKNEINTDIAISIGGDGTFLKTAKEIGSKNIPILGINTGRLGFLTDALPKDVETVLDEIINKHYCIEERSVLELSCCNKKFSISPYALNEIAILKRDSSSMITIHASINNTYINSYQADGLVIATPTGTTAYSLSVGGPIIVPYTDTIAITPVAPHSLNVRPIVIRDDWEITLEVESRSHNFLVALDGESITCKENNKLIIKKAKHCVKVIKRSNHTFFDSLRDKMMWGADNRKGTK